MKRKERILMAAVIAINLTIAYWLIDWGEAKRLLRQPASPAERVEAPVVSQPDLRAKP